MKFSDDRILSTEITRSGLENKLDILIMKNCIANRDIELAVLLSVSYETVGLHNKKEKYLALYDLYVDKGEITVVAF